MNRKKAAEGAKAKPTVPKKAAAKKVTAKKAASAAEKK